MVYLRSAAGGEYEVFFAVRDLQHSQEATPCLTSATGAKQKGRPPMNRQDTLEEAIRLRAYQLYQARGSEDGHDQDDWLVAETEIMAMYSPPAGPESAVGPGEPAQASADPILPPWPPAATSAEPMPVSALPAAPAPLAGTEEEPKPGEVSPAA